MQSASRTILSNLIGFRSANREAARAPPEPRGCWRWWPPIRGARVVAGPQARRRAGRSAKDVSVASGSGAGLARALPRIARPAPLAALEDSRDAELELAGHFSNHAFDRAAIGLQRVHQ